MFNFLKKFERAMAAAAFAEAGEFVFARQYLDGQKTANQKILLGADDREISPKVINHALSLCARMESSLEIFQIFPPHSLHPALRDPLNPELRDPEEEIERLAALKVRLEDMGIYYQYAIKEHNLVDELSEFVAKRRDIMVVVLQQQLAERAASYTDIDLTRYFKCPVALIEA